MDQRKIPWKAEWKAAGVDPGTLSPEEESLVPQLQEENRRFLENHPYPGRSRPQPLVHRAVWSLPLAAAAAVLLFVTLPGVPENSGGGLERMKGSFGAVLSVYRQTGGRTEKLESGAVVKPGDVLQASYRVNQATQGALLSVDGNRQVTVHLSASGRSVGLSAGVERPLASSYELDKAPKFEVFYLFVSPVPFEIEPLRQKLQASSGETLKAGAFGSGIEFTVLALKKEPSR